jgi:hypothetical protein
MNSMYHSPSFMKASLFPLGSPTLLLADHLG